MRSKKALGRITMSRETLRQLTKVELGDAAAGYPYTHTCPPTVSQCALSACVVCTGQCP
jgi:hypothetical protein